MDPLGIAVCSAMESCEKVADSAVETLDGVCLGLRSGMPVGRKKRSVGLPMVGHVPTASQVFDFAPQFSASCPSTSTEFPGKYFSGVSIKSNPQPDFSFFFPT